LETCSRNGAHAGDNVRRSVHGSGEGLNNYGVVSAIM
jgi:hypothetical protein